MLLKEQIKRVAQFLDEEKIVEAMDLLEPYARNPETYNVKLSEVALTFGVDAEALHNAILSSEEFARRNKLERERVEEHLKSLGVTPHTGKLRRVAQEILEDKEELDSTTLGTPAEPKAKELDEDDAMQLARSGDFLKGTLKQLIDARRIGISDIQDIKYTCKKILKIVSEYS